MGEVFLAHDKLLERPVAIKFLSNLNTQEDTREKYLIEARAAARLQHPNVVTVYSVGEIDGRPYIVSEYLKGTNLQNVHKPMPWAKALDLGVRLSRGLEAAHRSGVLHLDIKPGNVILTETGELKLLDFGLAKCLENSLPPLEPPVEAKDAIAPTMDIVSPEPIFAPGSKNDSGEAEEGDALEPGGEEDPALAHVPSITRKIVNSGANGTAHYDHAEVKKSSSESAGGGWASTIKGTPHYMAPEVMLGRQATRSSDVYSLGALLFELCAGATPYYDVPAEKIRELLPNQEAPPLLHVAPTVDPRFGAIIDRCLRRAPNERYASAKEVREALEQLTEASSEQTVPEGNPYRGILPYEPDHQAVFFGRNGEIGTLFERLCSLPCLLVAGDPGVGKSSLCRAGVLPVVHARGITQERQWKSAVMQPGRTPISSLIRAVSQALGCPEEMLAQVLQIHPDRFAQAVARVSGPHTGLVLFIDQLEDLLAPANAADVKALREAVDSLLKRPQEFRVLCAVRQGALASLGRQPDLLPFCEHPIYDLRPMQKDAIKETITGPAEAKGVRFEPQLLIDDLISATLESESGVPLLQIVLAELWEARKGSVINASSLHSIGGFDGAANRHADHVLGRLSMEQRAQARTLLLALVERDLKPRKRTGSELLALGPDLQPVLDALVRGRLIAVHDAPEGSTYSLASRVLCDSWKTLHKWLEESPDNVPRRAALTQTSELVRQPASRRRLAWAAIPLLLLGIYGLTFYRLHRQQDLQLEKLYQQGRDGWQQAIKSAAAVRITKQAGFSALIAGRSIEVEDLYRRAQRERDVAETEYRNASHTLERALNIDGSRKDLRSLLADILIARIILAEGQEAQVLRSDLLERVALYDEDGARRKHLEVPGRLIVESRLSDAAIEVARIGVSQQSCWEVLPAQRFGKTPRAEFELTPGDYMITLHAEGYAPLRQPVFIENGKEIRIKAELRKAETSLQPAKTQ